MPGFGIGFNFGLQASTGGGGGPGGGSFPYWVTDTENYLFTSHKEIQALFSSVGERQHLDDLNPSDDNYDDQTDGDVTRLAFIEELCQRATSHVMSYLGPRYSAENIYQIPRIREIATYWACYKLSRRRGNQPVYEDDYYEAMDDLVKFRSGAMYLDAPSSGPRAIMQSYYVDNRLFQQPLRVLSQSSSSTISGQKLGYRQPFFWL